MLNRPTRFTEADLRRAVRVAEKTGLDWAVEVTPDGTIRLVRIPSDKQVPKA